MERCDDALLLTSELVTNAVLHGRSEVSVEVEELGRLLRISVFDENSRHPTPVPDDPDALGAPSAQVTLLSDEQVVVSRTGSTPPAGEASGPREASLCTATVRGHGPLVVSDAIRDERVSALPPVTSGAVGAYLGVPLVDSAGLLLGVLCVYDGRPRALRTFGFDEVAVAQALDLHVGSALTVPMVSRGCPVAALTVAQPASGPLDQALVADLAGRAAVALDLELATLLVASYDPSTGCLTVASAGHPPPLLAELGKTPAFVDVEPGPPLGTLPGDYEEVVVQVPEGATLLLYTGGLVENRSEPLSHGLERLRQALVDVQLPPERVADHVLEVTGRVQGADDDVALLVVSRVPDA